MKPFLLVASLLWCLGLALPPAASAAKAFLDFGFARRDITPDEPVRLSGYSSRNRPSEGVAQRIWTRAMAMRTSEGTIFVLANADTIGFPGEMTSRVAAEVEKRHGVPRDRLVLCATHSHTTPHLAGGLTNMFGGPLPDTEQKASERYTEKLFQALLAVVDDALADLRPGTLAWGQGKAGFPINRRVLQNAKWAGFGETPEGVVDRLVPVLLIRGEQGRIRGVLANCACHCTTLGGDYFQVTGDWAGYAAEYLENRYADATAIITIGCGADANPAPRGTLEHAQMHGRELASEVERVISGDMEEIISPPVSAFGYAGLPSDRPTIDELKSRLSAEDRFVRNHAQSLIATYERMGRLPETYPCPVHVWRFGDQLGMVFLGGEVVADYAIRLRQELQPDKLWVSAYTDDVFAYVASERMRAEGGYEVDGSMIYYGRPGRWSTGTEEVLVRRVHELWQSPGTDQPKSPDEAMKTFRLAPELEIEQVAAEPFVLDPINIAFGEDGRLWVVEMGDYPNGEDGQGSPGGRVRFLEDRDQDGEFDRSTLFLDGLEFPTAAIPWRDGVLIASAPQIFIARDTDGDGRADQRRVILEGFKQGNPQHRVNGFDIGLDNWVYAGHGYNDRTVRSAINGREYDIFDRDFRFHPDTGELDVVGGQAGFVRSRDDWGNWFLGDNSNPIQHQLISDRYLRRNPYAAYPRMVFDLLEPALNPPVFPASRTVDRFNDLSTANRFTSACSPAPYRATLLGEAFHNSAFVCEPVHNLVHRLQLVRQGTTFRGKRYPEEVESEFLASTDNWFRPVRVQTGPDGAVWICDMYRLVIEHPEWIPEAWQQQLDLRAGHDRGRIYRIYPRGARPRAWPRLAGASITELVSALASDAGPLRDTAQRLLVHRQDMNAAGPLKEVVNDPHTAPVHRLHALATLQGLGALDAEILTRGLHDESPGVRRLACELCEPYLNARPDLAGALAAVALLPLASQHGSMDGSVRLQALLSLGEWDNEGAAEVLAKYVRAANIGGASGSVPWDAVIEAAIVSSAAKYPLGVLEGLVRGAPLDGRFAATLIATALGDDPAAHAPWLAVSLLTTTESMREQAAQAELGFFLDGLKMRGLAWNDVLKKLQTRPPEDTDAAARVEKALERFTTIIAATRIMAADNTDPDARRSALLLLARLGLNDHGDLLLVKEALASQHPSVQSAAVESLALFGGDEAADSLLAPWKSYVPEMRRQVLRVLLQRPGWVARVLDAMEAGTIRPGELDASSRDILISWRDEAVRRRARELMAVPEDESRTAVLNRYRGIAAVQGDAARGAAVFQRLCATCHRHGDVGTPIGPDLASLTNKSDEALLVAILDPNRAVEYHYEAYTIITHDGRVLSGMITEQSASMVRIVGTDGKAVSIPREQIETLAGSEKSLMPEGLERDLSVEEMAHLLAYLRMPPVVGGN